MTDSRPVPVPSAVRALATRLGVPACPKATRASLTQHGSLREAPSDRWRRFSAHQHIRLRETAFEWRASMRPFGAISVVDALTDGVPNLEVRLFRCIRLARVSGSDAASRGELIRYLAELPWAPDAMLANRGLAWTVVDDRTIRVGASLGTVHAEVEFVLDSAGRVQTASAHGRPRREGDQFVERPWQGRFSGYRQHQGRVLPFRGEVGWVLDGQAFTAWKGRIDSWTLS